MTARKSLLAKSHSSRPPEPEPEYALLSVHLRIVAEAGRTIARTAGSLFLQQLNLPEDPWSARLEAALELACLLHDVGKANDAFQEMVRGRLEPARQPVRHELLSALFLTEIGNPIREFLEAKLSGFSSDVRTYLLNCIVGAVASHHVKLDPDWNRAAPALKGGCGVQVVIELSHPDLAPFVGGGRVTDRKLSLLPSSFDGLESRQLSFQRASRRWLTLLGQDASWRRFAAALKALTIAADVAGSALPPRGGSVSGWISACLGRRLESSQATEVVRSRLGERRLRPFQEAIGSSGARVTLVEAGCGSGKTVAAYLWAARHASDRKLFFCYPTTGTATEGFLDYAEQEGLEAELMHSRAIVDLAGHSRVRDEDPEEQAVRIESLRGWGSQVLVCTADTVLSLIRCNRRGLYLSPAILSGSFVFDELHAYDDTMFGAVLALMDALPGARFLLMTASLPHARKRLLQERCPDMAQVASPAELEAIPRYHLEPAGSFDVAWTRMREAVTEKRRVLWIVNTVGRAQRIAAQAALEKLPVCCYHSRFKYVDRCLRHREVVDRFSASESRGMLAVTTQVAEMSLDLDADLLITELAPIPALIQRLGRLNRRVTPEAPGSPRVGLWLEPEKSVPYTDAELASAREWLERLRSLERPLSQQDLAAAFLHLADDSIAKVDVRSEWLDAGWEAQSGPVREGSCSVSVILQDDEERCRQDKSELIRCAIPMTYSPRLRSWRTYRGHFLAPAGALHYDSQEGATWQPG